MLMGSFGPCPRSFGDAEPQLYDPDMLRHAHRDAAGRYCSLPASIAAKISSCVRRYSWRAVLSLSVAPLRPHSRSWRSMSGHYLPAEEFAEAGADHGDAGTGLALVVPGLSPAHQGLAVLGPGEVRLAQDLPEHRIDRVRVGGGQAAERQGPDCLRPQVPAQDVGVLVSGRESRVGEQGAQHPVLVIEVKPVGLVVDDADGVRVCELGRELEGGHVDAGEVLWPTARGLPGERGFLPM